MYSNAAILQTMDSHDTFFVIASIILMIKSSSVIHNTTERTGLICSPNHRALIKDWEAYVLYVHKVPFDVSLVHLLYPSLSP